MIGLLIGWGCIADDGAPNGGHVETGATADRIEHSRTGNAELTGKCGKGEHRTTGRPAVAVAFLSPADAQHRRPDRSVHLGEPFDVGLGNVADIGSARRSPLQTSGQVPVGAIDPSLDERFIEVTVALHQGGERHRQHTVGAGPHGEVQIGTTGDRRASRIDDDQTRSGAATLLDHRRQVRMRHVGVGAPHDDQLAVLQILRIGRGQ